MSNNVHMRVIASEPVNATAGRVMSKGIHYQSQRKPGDTKHWKAPPSVIPLPKAKDFKDLTYTKFGRFTVVGYLGRKWEKAKAMWLVKCSCGDYEARTSKAIQNPNNANDMCVECRHLEYIKTHNGRGVGTVTFDGRNA